MNPQGAFTFYVLRPLSDLVLWLWHVERRFEFLYRRWFDRWLRPPLFAAAQWLQNLFRRNEHLELAQERLLTDEEQLIQEIIDEIALFMRENWLPGAVQRFGNTKTYGVLRGRVHGAATTSRNTCGTGCSRRPGRTRRGCGSPGRGRTRRRTWRTSGSARWASR